MSKASEWATRYSENNRAYDSRRADLEAARPRWQAEPSELSPRAEVDNMVFNLTFTRIGFKHARSLAKWILEVTEDT